MFSMNFKEWLLLNENASANIDRWLSTLIQYAKPEEKRVLDLLEREGIIKDNPPSAPKTVRDDFRRMIAEVLARKGKENMNWFAFSLGYLSVKKFRKEDLEMALDAMDSMKASGKITPSEIGTKGWMITGISMEERMPAYLRSLNAISNRAGERMRKSGEIKEEDAKLVRHVARSGDMDLYYLPPVPDNKLDARHRVLCKFGANTEWCTANPTGTYHQSYQNYGIFILYSGGSPKYQFIACSELPERKERDHEEEENEDEWPGQFMDVHDKPVKSLTPEEEKFIRKNGDAACYGLIPEGFDDFEDFMSSSEEKAESVSGKVAAEVIIMAGVRAGEAILKMGHGPILKISRSQAYDILESRTFNTPVANSILSALHEMFVSKKVNAYFADGGHWFGVEYLMVGCIKASTNPTDEIVKFNSVMKSKMIEELFSSQRGSNLDADALLKLAEALEKPSDSQFASIMVAAMRMNKVRDVFLAMSDRLDNRAFASPRNYTYNAMDKILKDAKSQKIDQARTDELAELLERNFEQLPPSASYWVVAFSKDKESTAKRMLAKNPKDEWVKSILSADPGLRHLIDDSHVRQISRSRSRTRESLVDMARRYGAGDEGIKRFLLNSDDVSPSEVVAALDQANDPEKLANELPEDMINAIDEDQMKQLAERAEKVCRGGYGLPGKERGGCSEGKPLIAIIKHLKRHFPMEHLVFMNIGKERDDLIMRNMDGAEPDEMRQAMDLADNHDLIAEKIVQIRGPKITPGEMLSVLIYASQEKFMEFLDRFGDKINSLDEPYASAYKGKESIRGNKFIDRILSMRNKDKKVIEILKRYEKELGPKTIVSTIRSSENRGEVIEKLAHHIRKLDDKSYEEMVKAMKHDHASRKADEESLAIIDDIRNGPMKERDPGQRGGRNPSPNGLPRVG